MGCMKYIYEDIYALRCIITHLNMMAIRQCAECCLEAPHERLYKVRNVVKANNFILYYDSGKGYNGEAFLDVVLTRCSI